MIRMIKEGISPVICPGGVQEASLITNPKECVLYLTKRLGFVKLAMQQGIAGHLPIFIPIHHLSIFMSAFLST